MNAIAFCVANTRKILKRRLTEEGSGKRGDILELGECPRVQEGQQAVAQMPSCGRTTVTMTIYQENIPWDEFMGTEVSPVNFGWDRDEVVVPLKFQRSLKLQGDDKFGWLRAP